MPELGDIKTTGKWCYKQIWHACITCGKERWTEYDRKIKQPTATQCRPCSLKTAHRSKLYGFNAKGYRHQCGAGYYQVRVFDDDFFSSMRNKKGYVLEHRLVMAKHLGRCLQPFEAVHHKNGIKDDNRIENLEIIGKTGEHIASHNKGYQDGFRKGFVDGRNKRIQALQEQINLLRARIA